MADWEIRDQLIRENEKLDSINRTLNKQLDEMRGYKSTASDDGSWISPKTKRKIIVITVLVLFVLSFVLPVVTFLIAILFRLI